MKARKDTPQASAAKNPDLGRLFEILKTSTLDKELSNEAIALITKLPETNLNLFAF